jgi:DNA-binding beta-propeller fold protein YncE
MTFLALPAAARYSVKKTIPLGATGTYPHSLAFNPVRNKVYCSNTGSGSISVIDVLQDSLLANVPVTQPGEMVYAQGSDRLFVHDMNTELWAISGSGDTVETFVSFGQGWCELAYNQLQDRLYVSNPTDGLAFYTSSNLAYLGYNAAVNGNVFFAEPVQKLYGVAGAQVYVLDGASNAVIDSFSAMGIESNSLFAYNPAAQKLYVTTAQGDLVVVDAVNDDVITMLPLGASPAGMAFCPLNNAVYAALPSGELAEVFPDETYNFYSTGSAQLSGVSYNPADSLIYTIDFYISKGMNMMMLFDPLTQAFRDSVPMMGSNMYTNVVVDNDGDVYTADYMNDQAYAVGRVPGRLWRSNTFSGLWQDYNSWEYSDNGGGTWGNPMNIFPTSPGDSTILIKTGDAVILDAGSPNIVVDELVINGTLAQLGSWLEIADGPGVDLTVTGNFQFSGGSFTKAPTAAIVFDSLGMYTHGVNGGSIPQAQWQPLSTLRLTQVQDQTPAGLDQNFGRIIWDCPGQFADAVLPGGPSFSVRGLEVQSTGSTGRLMLTSSIVPEVTISGDLIITGSSSQVMAGGSGVRKLTVGGNLSLEGSPPLALYNPAAPGICTLKVRGDYTYILGKNGKGLIGPSGPDSAAVVFDGGGDHNFAASGELVSGSIDYLVEPGNRINMYSPLGRGSQGRFTLSAGATLGITDTLGLWPSPADSGQILVTGVRHYDQNANYIFAGTMGSDMITGPGFPDTVGKLYIVMAGIHLSRPLAVADTLSLFYAGLAIHQHALSLLGPVANDTMGGAIVGDTLSFASRLILGGTENGPDSLAVFGNFEEIVLDRPGQLLMAGYISEPYCKVRNLSLYNGLCLPDSFCFLADSGTIARHGTGQLGDTIRLAPGGTSRNLVYSGGLISPGPEMPADSSELWDLTIPAPGDGLMMSAPLVVNGTLTLGGTLSVDNSDVTLKGPINTSGSGWLYNMGMPTTVAVKGGGAGALPNLVTHHLEIDRPTMLPAFGDIQCFGSLRFVNGSMALGAHSLFIGDSLVYSVGSLNTDSLSSIIFGYGSGQVSLPPSVLILDSLVLGNPNGLSLTNDLTIKNRYVQTAGRITAGTLHYRPGAELVYRLSVPDATSEAEFPSMDGPTNLTVQSSLGELTLHASRTIPGQVSLLEGMLTTGPETLFVAPGGQALSMGGYVHGNLAKHFPIGNDLKQFEVGTPGNRYTPLSLQLYNSVQPGYVTISAADSVHPQVDSAANCLNRYWRVSGPGISCSSSEVVLNYLPDDFTATFTEADYESTMAVGRYGSPGDWQFPAVISRLYNGPNDGGSIILQGGGTFDDNPEFTTGRDQASIHLLADTVGPAIASTIPPDGATGVALNASAMVSFTEPIDTSLFAFEFSPDPGGLNVSWNPDLRLATFDHLDFNPLTPYTVTILSAPDSAGNPLDTTVIPGHWSFTTGTAADTTPPAAPESLQIYGFNPSYWLSGPTFSVPVGWVNPSDSSGIARAFFKVYAPPANPTDFTDSIMVVGGARDTFWLPVDTLNGTMPVYVWLRDGAGNVNYLNHASVSARRDIFPPIGAAIKPFVSDTSVTTSFWVNWSPGSDALSGIQAWRVLSRIDTSAAWDTLAPFTNDTTALFSGALAGHRYYFEAAACDSAYNWEAFTGTAEASIYVAQPQGDSIPPYILYTAPANGAVGVGLADSVTISFSEPIRASGFLFSFSPDPGGLGSIWNTDSTRVRIDHPALAAATRYVVRVTAALDTMGLALAGPDSFSFITVAIMDTVRPNITAAAPANGQTNVALNMPVVISFSEPVDTASFRFNCTPNVAGWSVAWSGGQTASLSHVAFAANTVYTFRVDSVADPAGNPMDTSAPPNQPWSFTTVGPTAMANNWSGGAWRLFSVPLLPQDSSATGLLGDDLGAYSDTTWRLVGYKPNYGYVERPPLWLGQGYWLASAQNANIDVEGYPLSEPQTTALDSGWNIIGNPFDTVLALSGLRVRWNDGTPHELYYGDSLVNAVLRQFMWQYLDNTGDLVNNGYWDSLAPAPVSDTLRPWQGYAVYAVRPCSLLMERIFKGKPVQTNPQRQVLWQMELSASMGPWADPGLKLGISPQAAAGYDRLDAEKPPLVSENLAIYLPHDDWGQGPCRRYLRDVRPPGNEQRWLVRAEAGQNLPIEIDYAIFGAPEPGYRIYLVDRKLGQAFPVNGAGRLTMARSGEIEVVYTARGLGDLDLKPLEFGLTRISPNPFRGRISISYQLDRPGRVSLRVYNSLGQLAAVLDEGYKEAGFHAISWDGDRAAAGIYLVRLESEGRSRVTKTVKLR